MGRASRILVAVLAFVAPALAVYELLGVAWPPQHDLSDIGTGLIRLMAALGAGVAGLVVRLLFTRASRR